MIAGLGNISTHGFESGDYNLLMRPYTHFSLDPGVSMSVSPSCRGMHLMTSCTTPPKLQSRMGGLVTTPSENLPPTSNQIHESNTGSQGAFIAEEILNTKTSIETITKRFAEGVPFLGGY